MNQTQICIRGHLSGYIYMREAMLHAVCLCAHATAIGQAILIESSVGPIYLYNECRHLIIH